MYPDDHNPPHFHARYQDKEIVMAIRSINLLNGKFPPRIMYLIKEWAEIHQSELSNNWHLLKHGKEPKKIAPLE